MYLNLKVKNTKLLLEYTDNLRLEGNFRVQFLVGAVLEAV